MVKEVKLWFQENLRLIIHKFPAIYRLCLKAVRDYGRLYYMKLDKKYGYKEKIRSLKGSKYGQRCFIVGSGPSLKAEDLDRLVNEDCFAMNRIYNIFPQTKWRPLYYIAVDWHGLGEGAADLIEAGTFWFGDYFWRKNRMPQKNTIVFYAERILDTKLSSFKFSEDISERVCWGATAAYVCLQIAAYLGYSEIYLLGIDHNYAYVLDASGSVVKNEEASNTHFYAENDVAKMYADAQGMTNAYLNAKEYADTHGIKIYNATRGGKLEVFERVNLDDVL